MSILPVPLARVSNLLRSEVAQSSIAAAQQRLVEVQNQISTGKRINSPGDDPGAAAVVQQLQKTLEARTAYADNLKQANAHLGAVDSTLGDLNDLLQQAQNLASANVGSDVTPSQRAAAAEVVRSIQNQVLSLANTQSQGAYLFAGDRSTATPFVDQGNGIQFVGSSNVLKNAVDETTALPFMVDGAEVFGALSTRVRGSVDLAPAVTADTRLIDLGGAGGNGVHLGSIRLGDGTQSVVVDLAKADTLGDVAATINAAASAAGMSLSASVAGRGLRVNGPTVTVGDVGGATAAADLGIATAPGGAAGPVVGQPVGARVTGLTRLADLRGGAGIDTDHGLTITNGGKSAAIDLSGAKTVEDLLNAVNGSGLGVLARVNAAGTGIDLVNPTQGTAMTVGEAGGTTAADLGVRSFAPDTPLAQLNGGKGVADAAGADFQITRRDGATFAVDVAGAKTVRDVLDRINASGGGVVTASFAATGNGIVLSDASGGPGALAVTPLNNSTAAADLGLSGPSAASDGATVRGGDVNAASAEGIFGNLDRLARALSSSDTAGITAAATGLKNDYDRVTAVRGRTGAQVQEIESRQTRLDDQNVSTQSLLSSLQDTDMTSAITQFTQLQTALQASLQTTVKVMNLSLLDFLG